jgi:serine protease Do
MKSQFAYSLLLIMALAFHPAFSEEKKAKPTLGQLHDRMAEASFEILINGRLEGTGFLVDQEGHAVTVWHAAKRKGKLEAHSKTLGRLAAKIVAHNRGHDLALIQLPLRNEPYPFLPIANRNPGPGQPVYLLGSPIFRHQVFITGNIARKGTTFEYFDGNFVEGIHVAAMTPGGCSGGPWANRLGQVVGMQSASMTLPSGHQGIATMIPPKSISKLLERKENIFQPTLQMAVEEIWGQDGNYLKAMPEETKGLVVRQLQKEGVAAKAGVMEWDIVLKVDGQIFEETDAFIRHLRKKKPGDHLRMELMSKDGSNKRTAKVKLSPLK